MCFEKVIREKKVHHNNWCAEHKQFCPDARNGECVAKWCQYDVYDRMCVGCPREKHCHEEMDFCDEYLDAVEAMKKDEAIQAQPRKRGKWKRRKDEAFAGGYKTECSVCHYAYSDKCFFEAERFNYCPHCGAQMEVDDG